MDCRELIANHLPVKSLCALRHVNRQWRNTIATMDWKEPECVVINLHTTIELVRWTIFLCQFTDDKAMQAAIRIGGLPFVRFRIDIKYYAKKLFLQRFPNLPLHELKFESPIHQWVHCDARYMQCESLMIEANDPFPTNVDGITFIGCLLNMQYFAQTWSVRNYVRLANCTVVIPMVRKLGTIDMSRKGVTWTVTVSDCATKALTVLTPIFDQCDVIEISCIMRETVKLPGNARVREIHCYGDLVLEGNWPNLQTVTVTWGSFVHPQDSAWRCSRKQGLISSLVFDRVQLDS